MYDLVIIGGGPTGINCGIAASKSKLKYCILEKGVLVNAIYNFPTNMTFFSTSKNLEIGEIPFISHADKPSRKEALEYYRRLADHYKLNIHYKSKVTHISGDAQSSFTISVGETTLHTKHIVIATGFYDTPRLLKVPGEGLPKVKHYYDDAHPYIGMKVTVVGGANSACDVALETWMNGADVTMVVRDKQLYQKVKYWILPNIENRIKEGSIKAYFESEIVAIKEDSIDVKTPQGNITIDNDYVLAMTGYTPDFTLFDLLNVEYADKVLKTPVYDEATLQTNVEGVYTAGVMNGGLKTSSLFIENTRDHGEKILGHILSKS